MQYTSKHAAALAAEENFRGPFYGGRGAAAIFRGPFYEAAGGAVILAGPFMSSPGNFSHKKIEKCTCTRTTTNIACGVDPLFLMPWQ